MIRNPFFQYFNLFSEPVALWSPEFLDRLILESKKESTEKQKAIKIDARVERQGQSGNHGDS
jgi:hypothetical protein